MSKVAQERSRSADRLAVNRISLTQRELQSLAVVLRIFIDIRWQKIVVFNTDASLGYFKVKIHGRLSWLVF